MSRENVEAHKRGIEAINRNDVEAMLEELDSEVEWHPEMQAFGGAPIYRGKDGVRTLFRDLFEVFAEVHVDCSEVRDLGDRTLAIGRVRRHTRGRESGAETESAWNTLAEFKDGKVIRVRTYLDPEVALAAAGLSE